jgi:hypothetical protein
MEDIMQDERKSEVIYGQNFRYQQLRIGNAHEEVFDRLGQVEPHVEIPAGYLERYRSWIGFMGPGCEATVYSYPGNEKHLGRWFRYYSGSLIKILEIPEQYDYAGMFEDEFLRTQPKLDERQIQERLAVGLPVYHKGYYGTWSRLLFRRREEKRDIVELDLTPLNEWEWPEIGTIHFRVHCTEPRPEYADYAAIPDSVRDHIGERVGENLAARLLTENFMAEFTVEQLKAYSRSTCGTRMSLEKIRKAVSA